jgi:hypothetical protein
MERLLGEIKHGWPFTPFYAGDVWDVEVPVARRRLQALRWVGMVEALRGTEDMLWGAKELWRVTPIVYRTFGRMGRRRAPRTAGDRWRSGWRMFVAQRRRWRLARQVTRYGTDRHRMPVVFGMWLALWWPVWGAIKGLGMLVIGAIEMLVDRGWLQRWMDATVVLRSERHLRTCWAQSERVLTEDLQLLYDAQDMAGVRALRWVVVSAGLGVLLRLVEGAILAPGSGAQVVLRAASWALLAVSCMAYVWVFWPVAWRVWVAHLYGLATWDVLLALWVAGRA